MSNFTVRETHTARLVFESLVNDSLRKFGFFQLGNRLLLGLQGKYVLRLFVEYKAFPSVFFLVSNSFVDYYYRDHIFRFEKKDRVKTGRFWRGKFGKSRAELLADKPFLCGKKAYYFPDTKKGMIWVGSANAEISGYYFRIEQVSSSGKVSLNFSPAEKKSHRFLKRVIKCVKNDFCKVFDVDLGQVMDAAVDEGARGIRFKQKNKFFARPKDTLLAPINEGLGEMAGSHIRELFEKEYLKIRTSPIRRYQGLPVRAIFHRKVFNRLEQRCEFQGHKERNGAVYKDGYHFDSELVLPDQQQADLVEGLAYIRDCNNGRTERTFGITVTKAFSGSGEHKIRRSTYPNKDMDDWFWTDIVKNPKLFIDTLLRPLEKHERLFSDSCLVSGILQHREDIFRRKSVRPQLRPTSFVQTTSENSTDIEAAMQRDVCYHYMCAMMSTTSTKNIHDLMLVPLRVNGAPFGSLSTVFGSYVDHTDTDRHHEIYPDSSVFFRNWFFYKNIAASMNSDMRRDMQNAYLRVVNRYFQEAITRAQYLPIKEVAEHLNLSTGQLQRFFPFERLYFSGVPAAPVGKKTIILPVTLESYICLDLHSNEFYSKFGDMPFLTPSHYRAEWKDADHDVKAWMRLNKKLSARKDKVM